MGAENAGHREVPTWRTKRLRLQIPINDLSLVQVFQCCNDTTSIESLGRKDKNLQQLKVSELTKSADSNHDSEIQISEVPTTVPNL